MGVRRRYCPRLAEWIANVRPISRIENAFFGANRSADASEDSYCGKHIDDPEKTRKPISSEDEDDVSVERDSHRRPIE